MEFNCIGILREKPDKKFEFVVRWFFSDQQNPGSVHLPNPEGKFRVHIHKTKSGEYVNSQGRLVPRATGTPDLPVVTPLNYLMAAPPKSSSEPPQGPIDPRDMKGEQGIGIYHILADTRSSRTAKKISAKTAEVLASKRSLTANALFGELPPAEYADAFARYLVNERVRPRNLPAVFAHSFNRLEHITFREKGMIAQEQVPSLFHFHLNERYNTNRNGRKFHFGTDLESLWQNAAVLNDLFKDTDYLRAINDDTEKAENLKSQFTLLGLQGGEVIDFWCNPKVSQAGRDEDKCGLKYSSNEAVGLGLSIGNFELADIQDWLHRQESILIDVHYEAPTPAHLSAVTAYDWNGLHEASLLEDIPDLDAVQSVISATGTNSLENAVNAKSSCVPDVPLLATIEYDLFLKRIKTDLPEELRQKVDFYENLETGTGDGRVTFNVQKPADKPFPRMVRPSTGEPISTDTSSVITGINIYGIWEPEDAGSAYKKFFTDPTLQPDMDELAPWLITRRYSYHQELKPFFADTNPNIRANQKTPPRLPAFQHPQQVINLEKVLHVLHDKQVLNEVMPNRTQNEATDAWTTFVLNVREGFKNGFDAGIPSTWDKFPTENTGGNWQPDMWRSGTRKTMPQAYRFWATTVDLFGQESRPVPILHSETKNGQPGPLFYFKHRQTLQPPPSNTDTETDNITLTTDGNTLTTTWRSPFETVLGNSTDEQTTGTPVQQIVKDQLQANVLYLRKPHRQTTPDIDENKMEEYITQIVFPQLPAQFRNDKWRIGLREIFKHNQTWQVHQAIPGIVSTGTDHVWQHRLPLRQLDHGFDYMALFNFEIRSDKKQFWTADEPARTLFVTEQHRANAINQDFYATPVSAIEETPGTGHTAYTDSVLVPDTLPPRSVFISDHHFWAAKPVLGIQGINRDMVLSNIITTPDAVNEVQIGTDRKLSVVFASTPEERAEDILYTGGQKIMAEAALSRCRQPEGTDLELPLRILKNGLSNLNKKRFMEAKDSQNVSHYLYSPNDGSEVVTGDLPGFRGLMSFTVNYRSIYSAVQPATAESEALKFHVYQMRIPLTGNPETGASFSAVRFRQVNATAYTGVEPETSAELRIAPAPVFVIARYTDGFTVAQIKALEQQAGTYAIETRPPVHREGIISGNPEKLVFVVSNPVIEKEMEPDTREPYICPLLLPIGGGMRELFVWSFQTTSALGRCSEEWLTETHIFQSSVLPPAPQVISASTIDTSAQKNTYFLKSTDHKNWLPERLKNTRNDNLIRQPRNILQWAKNESLPDDVYLTIERDVRSEDVRMTRSLVPVQNSWQLASNIEKGLLTDADPLLSDGTQNPEYNPYGLLFTRWLLPSQAPTLYAWLFESAEIPVPGNMAGRPDEEKRFVGPGGLLFNPASPLKAATGLLMIDDNPVFVDYFYDNREPEYEMDTFRSYNYRLHTYIDIDPDGQLGMTDPNLKYLRSKPTEWTGWIRPTFPEIEQVTVAEDPETKTDRLMPEIEFRFVCDGPPFRKMQDTPKNVFYRVILKKEIKNSISPDLPGSTEKSLVEFGGVLNIPVNPEPGTYYGITDSNIDREDNTRPVSLNYQLEILVVAIDAAENVSIVRKAFIRPVNGVKLSACGNDSELRKTLSVRIN